MEFNDIQQREKPLTEFLLQKQIVMIAVSNKSSDVLWFVLILEQKVAESNEADDYGYIIPDGCSLVPILNSVVLFARDRNLKL